MDFWLNRSIHSQFEAFAKGFLMLCGGPALQVGVIPRKFAVQRRQSVRVAAGSCRSAPPWLLPAYITRPSLPLLPMPPLPAAAV